MCTKTDGHQGLVKPYNVCRNREDGLAVAVYNSYKDQDVVGYVPRSISTQYIEYSISSTSTQCTEKYIGYPYAII